VIDPGTTKPARSDDDLRRELRQAQIELWRLRSARREADATRALARLERTERIRRMLTDTHSRNP
jgi:hypothetical protein